MAIMLLYLVLTPFCSVHELKLGRLACKNTVYHALLSVHCSPPPLPPPPQPLTCLQLATRMLPLIYIFLVLILNPTLQNTS